MDRDDIDYFGQSVRDSLIMVVWTMLGTITVFGLFLALAL